MPGSMQAPNFETFVFQNGTIDTCFRNTTITGICQQGSVPVIGVDARSVEDIQAAVNFSVDQNLKLVVKNTGHDYLERSTARGSFVVWTHNMKNITYNSAFVPQGASGNETYEAVTLGAGVQWHEAYAAVNSYGRIIVGTSAVLSMLKSIKDTYDPYRIFVVAEGIGSEDWNDDLTCRY